MTPGPIAPRLPVDPGPQSLQKSEGEPGSSDERRSFADLLQSMLAPAAAPVATPGASDSDTAAVVFKRLDAAQMFNETGLFRGAAPLAEQAVEAGPPPASGAPALPDTGAARPAGRDALTRREISPEAALQLSLAPAPGTPPAAPEGEAPGRATAARQIELAGGSLPPNATPTSREAIRATRSLRGQPVAAPPQPPAQTPEAARQSAAAGRRAETAVMLLQAYLGKGGSAGAQVSVQAVEGGISLVARADKLSREDRDKLRIEIGELLARHGLTAAQIMLNGEAWPSPQGRDE